MFDFKIQENDSTKPGQKASEKLTFGEFKRYAVFAVHTRFVAIQWLVTDAEAPDEVTGAPGVIRQSYTAAAATSRFRSPEDSRILEGAGVRHPLGKSWDLPELDAFFQ
jgi:hypothetical protein